MIERATRPSTSGCARRAPGLLRAFNEAGVLSAADVHVATRLAALGGESDEAVVLAAALAVRGPRLGHVYVDLATAHETATVEGEEPESPTCPRCRGRTPATGSRASPRARSSPGGALRLEGTALYLDRYWREEAQIAADLSAFGEAWPSTPGRCATGSRGCSATATRAQRLAAASAVAAAAGGGGGRAGHGQDDDRRADRRAADRAGAPRVTAARGARRPTGKAADRLGKAVHDEAARIDVDDATREQLLALEASTLHRLLGWRPGSHSRFHHHRGNRLPHDVVIVDETSMVSLSLMARLAEAVRPEARLILVGDPGQLASIEAGAVLGDIVGPAADRLVMRPAARDALAAATGVEVEAAPSRTAIGDGIVVLDRVHRFGGGIAAVAGAVRAGDADGLIGGLREGLEGVTWLEARRRRRSRRADPGPRGRGRDRPQRDRGRPRGRRSERARRPRRLPRALRSPPGPVRRRHVDGAHRGLGSTGAGDGPWYPGRPLLVTENDYGLRLFNGDTGVVVAKGDRVTAAFDAPRRGQPLAGLGAVETVYAMTIHKAQGSQFGTAAVLLPDPGSRLLTRELLYTAVTRASEKLILAGTEESIRAAVARPIARASGLRERLWG